MERSRVLIVVAIAATIAVAAAFVIWLQGQDDTSQSDSTTPPSSSSTTAPTSGVVIGGTPGAGMVTTPPTVQGDQVDLGQFSSPTGNIGCVLSSAFAVCEIGDHDFELPPEPTPCQGDYAPAIEFSDPTTRPTIGVCKTDTELGAPDQLAYGTTAVAGDFACLSQEAGMSCWNQRTGHGFTLSRAAYALF